MTGDTTRDRGWSLRSLRCEFFNRSSVRHWHCKLRGLSNRVAASILVLLKPFVELLEETQDRLNDGFVSRGSIDHGMV